MFFLQAGRHAEYLGQHELAEGYNQTCLLRNRNELNRRNMTYRRVKPAQQRLGAHDYSAADINLWLVNNGEFTPIQCAVHLFFQRKPP